ncbi:MAG: LamG-like jellyroll fold domain-containing protein, partial [Verrucomicrobiota bacterium]
VFWGTNNGGTSFFAWSNVASLGWVTNTALTNLEFMIQGLSTNTGYYYTFRATNCSEELWATPSSFFQTLSPPQVNAGTGAEVLVDRQVRLNGNLTGGGAGRVFFYWGNTDGGTITSAWDHVVPLGQQLVGPLSTVLTSANFSVQYYYRIFVTNFFGGAWTTGSVPFKLTRTNRPGLRVREFNTINGQALVNPVGNLQARTENNISLQTDDINYNNNFAANFAGITANTSFSLLWEGWFRPVAGPGVYTFGLNHDDRSMIAIDLNRDGDFDNGTVYDPGELVVNGGAISGGCCGAQMGQVILTENRAYRIAIALEQGAGGNYIDARWIAGPSVVFNELQPINGSSGAFFLESDPAVFENMSAMVLSTNAAVLQASASLPGAAYCVDVFWGASDAGTNAGLWDYTGSLGCYTNLVSTQLSLLVTNLVADASYAYTIRATNCNETIWAHPSAVFKSGLDVNSYAFQAKLQFCGYDRPETLSNFPALVLLGSNLPGFAYTQINPGATDLRFMDGAMSTELNYEIESWNTNGLSPVWVQVPRLIDSNTCIRLFWGSPPATNPPFYTTNGSVWSEDFAGVWHLNETTGTVRDVSANRYLSSTNGSPSLMATGIVNGADGFDGSGDFHAVPNLSAMNSSIELTFSGWAWLNTLGGSNGDDGGMICKSSGNPTLLWYNYDAGGGNFRTYSFNVGPANIPGNRINAASGTAVAQQWQYITGVMNGSYRGIYVDGRLINEGNSATQLTVPANVDVTRIGGWTTTPNFDFDGRLDEIRISTTARSSNWIWAAWNNMASNTSFICYTPPPVASGAVDLVLTKLVSTNLLDIGTNLTYTIDVFNNSTNLAGVVVVTDSLPADVLLLSSSPSPSETNGQHYTFQLGQLAGGSNAMVVIQGAVTSAIVGVLTNRAIVLSAAPESNPADNIDTALTQIPDSDGDGVANPADPDDDNDG